MSDYCSHGFAIGDPCYDCLRTENAAIAAMVDEITATLGERYGVMTTVEGVRAAMADLAAREATIRELEAKQAQPEKMAPVQGYSAGIPWAMHLRAYDAYCEKYGPQPALIEGGCRGGFGTNELDRFIPGWREELSELSRLRTENASLREREATKDARIAELELERDKANTAWEYFRD